MKVIGPPTTLTAHHVAVLELVGEGMRNAEIAKALQVSVETVKRYLSQSYDRLGAAGRLHAFVRAWQSGQLTLTRPEGEPPVLTGEQVLVLRIWAVGGTRLDIARALDVAESAAERYEENVLNALAVQQRVVAVRRALAHQLIDPAGDTLASLTTPTAAVSGQGRTDPREKGPAGRVSMRRTVRPVGDAPPNPGHGSGQVLQLGDTLRSVHGLVVHLGVLAGLPSTPPLLEVLAGATPREAAPPVVRLVHQALALDIPCALVMPRAAADPVGAVSVVGLACAWSSAVRQGTGDGTAAYVAAAHQLGVAMDEVLVVCTVDQAPVAAAAGPRQVLTTATVIPRTEPRRAPVPEITERERQIAELAAQGLTVPEIARRFHTGEYFVQYSLADLRRRWAVVDDAHLVARLISASLIDPGRIDAPERLPELDQAGRAVLALICTGTLSAAGARGVGLSLREARAAEAHVVRAFSPRRSRTHAAAIALATGTVTLTEPPAVPAHLEPKCPQPTR
ncbi:LuxR C-terminal-related transcriptional regulator [Kitasatospora sp. NPDC058243]|uniref:LuxR C-terminal-related transcriptional regulator n=1 Tax=Kitasatospora sp. NPDC058243 TaxID=3346397 RepID=UPI0036D9AFE8